MVFTQAKNCFPVGTALKGYPDGTSPNAIPASLLNTGPYRPGVFAMILPYLEQEALYQSLRMDLAIDEDVNVALGKTMIPFIFARRPTTSTDCKKPRIPCRWPIRACSSP